MKKKLSIFLILSILVSNLYIMPVYALDSAVQSIVHFENGVLMGYEKLLQYAGMIIDPVAYSTRATAQFIRDRLIAFGLISNDATQEDVQEFFNNNISQNGNEVEYSSDLNVYIKGEMEAIVSDAPYVYSYTGNIDLAYSKFSDANRFYQLKKTCKDYQSNYLIRAYQNKLYLYAISADNGLVLSTSDTYYRVCVLYDYNTWQPVVVTSANSIVLTWDSSAGEYIQDNSVNNLAAGGQLFKTETPYWGDVSSGGYFQRSVCISSGGSINYKVFKTLNDFKASGLGIKPYYLTDAYRDYQNISGSYNTNIDNSISYGDVTNYINNYYDRNGEYPSDLNITIWINNGGSGSGGDNGGGGSGGDSGGDLGIFDFLSRIGQVLGNLIKNLGNVLAELVEGLAETVNSLFASIPQVFSAFMQGVFGWLPDEIISLITLGISAMILVGIIKIFKG